MEWVKVSERLPDWGLSSYGDRRVENRKLRSISLC